MLCLQAQLTVWPTAPTPTPPLLICSANYLGGLAWPTPPPLQCLAETALLPRPLGWARSPRLLSDTFQFIIKVFTSKLFPRGGHCPSCRVHPPSHSGHTGHLSHLRTALLFTGPRNPLPVKTPNPASSSRPRPLEAAPGSAQSTILLNPCPAPPIWASPYRLGFGPQPEWPPAVSVPGPVWPLCCPAAGQPGLGPLWPVDTASHQPTVCADLGGGGDK